MHSGSTGIPGDRGSTPAAEGKSAARTDPYTGRGPHGSYKPMYRA
jgi:hypothetical protein